MLHHEVKQIFVHPISHYHEDKNQEEPPKHSKKHTPLFMASPENHCFPNLEIIIITDSFFKCIQGFNMSFERPFSTL